MGTRDREKGSERKKTLKKAKSIRDDLIDVKQHMENIMFWLNVIQDQALPLIEAVWGKYYGKLHNLV